ncbi:MAG: hypothetical protein ACQCN4_05235 [Candidatus Bathyarchaeia archaeon]
MKDKTLKVTYRRGDDGQLYVLMYRGKLHLGTVEVNAFNCMKVSRGIANRAPVLVQYLPKLEEVVT